MNNKITQLFCFSLVLFGLLMNHQTLANTSKKLTSTEVDFFNQQANRPTKVKFWYQTGSKACHAKICLSDAQNPQQIAVISHGAFGSPRSMNWLGYALASQGWIVAGVAHYTESWVYGSETIDPSAVMRFWQRPQDVSFVIDSLSDESLFSTSLKTNKILMLGHSSGGFTTLAMVGAKLQSGKSEAYCLSEKAKSDKGCLYGKQKPKNQETDSRIEMLQAQMQDKRVVAAIALDPALGHATSEKSLSNIKVPTLLLGSVDNDFLPFTEHAKYYASHIQDARLVGIEQGAGHFVYIDQCNLDIEANGVPLCTDRKGVDRKNIQTQILNHLFGFISKNNLGKT